MPTTKLKSAEEWSKELSKARSDMKWCDQIKQVQLNALEVAVEIAKEASLGSSHPHAQLVTKALITQIEELKRK